VARSDKHRSILVAAGESLTRRTEPIDSLIAAAVGLRRHRLLAGAAAAGLLVAPIALRAWILPAVWVVPLVLDGYRLGRSARSVWRARTG